MTWVKSWQKCESYPWGQKDIKTLVWYMAGLRCLLVIQEDQSSRQLDIEFWNSGVRSLIKCTFGVYCSYVVVKAMCLMGSSKDWVWKGRSIFLVEDWGIFNNWGDKGESAKETKKDRKKNKTEWGPLSQVKCFKESMIRCVRCCWFVMQDEDLLMSIGFGNMESSREEKWRQGMQMIIFSLFCFVLYWKKKVRNRTVTGRKRGL